MTVRKVCPFVLRERDSRPEILVFRHPVGNDIQLVKGTVEAGEDPEAAARRELHEESGIANLSAIEYKGCLEMASADQIWYFFDCRPARPLPEGWTFFANDDGGLDFQFFWWNLNDSATGEWHSVFQQALEFIRSRV